MARSAAGHLTRTRGRTRVIWGSQARDEQVATGTFHCPLCQTCSVYSHQRITRYRTFFFIPLFPVRTLGEYVLCTCCAGAFRPAVLTMAPEQVDAGTPTAVHPLRQPQPSG
jgi:hypothetical protein